MINEELFIKVLKEHYQSHKTDMAKALEDFVLFGECRIPVEGIELPPMEHPHTGMKIVEDYKD